MKYVTYENDFTRHITVHKQGCSQIRKRGGDHSYGQGRYKEFQEYGVALSYAQSRSYEVRNCSFCSP